MVDKDQAIIQFSKKSMDRIQSEGPKKMNISQGEMAEKLAVAKEYGQKEIDEYTKLVEEFIAKTSDMALFKNVGPLVQEACIDMALNVITKPLFYGENIANIPKYAFLEVRKNMFMDLILKYCNEEKDGGDNDAT